MSRIGNPVFDNTVFMLKKASKGEKVPVWKATLKVLLKSRSHKPAVNVGKISKLTKEGQLILVPGKVLGGGVIDHRVVVGAQTFSGSAKSKIEAAGGAALSLIEFVEKYPEGKGVVLIGG